MRFVIAALYACGCVDLSEPPGWIAAEDYINPPAACLQSADPHGCEQTQAIWVKTYDGALSGSYDAQRNVALCLATGCDHAIREDHVLGCAWRIVIAGSDHPQTGAGDEADRQHFCGAGTLDDAGRKTAEAQSQTLLSLLKKTS